MESLSKTPYQSIRKGSDESYEISNKPYQERLKALDFPTLKFRRLRGDMFERYKVLSGIYDTSVAPEIPIISQHATRGNSLKIANRRCHYNLLKYSFSMRITNVWNRLPFSVVTAPSVNSFKNKLDKHWALQELIRPLADIVHYKYIFTYLLTYLLKYDWEAELSGTGSRSRVEF